MHPMFPFEAFPGVSGQWSMLLPNPSESLSAHSVTSLGNWSVPSSQVSPSESTHPNNPEVLFPKVVGQASGFVPLALSPYPSMSVSFHWLASIGNESLLSAHVSWSASKQPSAPLVDVPGEVGQSSSASS